MQGLVGIWVKKSLKYSNFSFYGMTDIHTRMLEFFKTHFHLRFEGQKNLTTTLGKDKLALCSESKLTYEKTQSSVKKTDK